MNLLNRISVYCFIKDINDINTGRIREIVYTVTRTYDLSSSSFCRTYGVGWEVQTQGSLPMLRKSHRRRKRGDEEGPGPTII